MYFRLQTTTIGGFCGTDDNTTPAHEHPDAFIRLAYSFFGMTNVEVDCPACGRYAVHEVLKQNGQATVECSECEHVHKVRVHEPRTVERRVVVSQGDESFSEHVPMRADETVRIGDEFVFEGEEGIFGVEVTDIEVEEDGDNRRVEAIEAEEADTVWTRVVDNVSVPVTLHTNDATESHDLRVPGDYSFVVGDTEEVGGAEFVVTGFVDRRTGDSFTVEGDDVQAKNAKRVYGEKV